MKIAVVTGAASGIGAACSLEFAAKNYQVIGIDIQNPIASVVSRELFLQFHTVDLSKLANIIAVVEEISKSIDHVDVIVNAAGAILVKPFQEMTEYDFDHIINVNTKAPFFLSQKMLPLMTNGEYCNRSIINITSVHSTATMPGLATYTASKGALTALTRTLALELAQNKIRVNAVQPGTIDTPMLRAAFEKLHCASGGNVDEIVAKDGANIPIGRVGIGKDIANAVYFLANEENSFISGESLVVDGGMLARLSTK